MPDPRLISRAQHAATLLERAWDRWRAAHGLAAEPLPPVSSYVGYSIEEPWGRPRVVFGVDAADAEKLAALLHECAASPRVVEQPGSADGSMGGALPPPDRAPQQVLDEVRVRIPAQGRTPEFNAARGQRRDAGQGAGPLNGSHLAEADAHSLDQILLGRFPDDAADIEDPAAADTGDLAAVDAGGLAAVTTHDETDDAAVTTHEDTRDPAAAGQGSHSEREHGPADKEPPEHGPADAKSPDGRAAEPAAGNQGAGPSHHGDARAYASSVARGVADTMAAELAGWAAGELPGQASARLAAWATVGGASARNGADLGSGGGAEEVSGLGVPPDPQHAADEPGGGGAEEVSGLGVPPDPQHAADEPGSDGADARRRAPGRPPGRTTPKRQRGRQDGT
jgi:hypothetical protein